MKKIGMDITCSIHEMSNAFKILVGKPEKKGPGE
jgi:hypothetical protein